MNYPEIAKGNQRLLRRLRLSTDQQVYVESVWAAEGDKMPAYRGSWTVRLIIQAVLIGLSSVLVATIFNPALRPFANIAVGFVWVVFVVLVPMIVTIWTLGIKYQSMHPRLWKNLVAPVNLQLLIIPGWLGKIWSWTLTGSLLCGLAGANYILTAVVLCLSNLIVFILHLVAGQIIRTYLVAATARKMSGMRTVN